MLKDDSQYIRDKRIQERLETKQRLRQGGSEIDLEGYRKVEQETIEELIASGQINKAEFLAAKAQRK